MTPTDHQRSDVEVEWQLDAIDLRPVERWFSSRGAVLAARSPGRSAPSGRSGAIGPRPDSATEGPERPLLPAVPGLQAVAQPVKRLVDSYFDTPDWRLGRSGYVLRTRQRAGRYEATLKDLSPSIEGLRRRLEVTEPLASSDLAGLDPAGPVGRRVRALAGSRTLRPVLEVRTRRRPYALEVRGTGVGEVALDDTVIVAGSEQHRVRLQRVEVEVQSAWVESLSPLVEALRHDCGLQPATLSKFEAGLLGAGFAIPGPADLGPTSISDTSSLAELAYAVLRKDASAMLTHEPGTRLGEEIESLHQMRVATRRMRAALTLFETVLPARAARLHEELGWLAAVLGAVRDLDIQLGNIDSWTEEIPGVHRQALDVLGDLLQRHHDAARAELLEALDSRRYERLVSALTSILDQGPLRRPAAGQVPALEALPELIGGRHRAAEKAVRRAHRTGVLADFHRLRIRCKRLRYAIEFTGDLYGGDVRRYARYVASLQDELGLIQDAETAADRLQEIALGEEGALLPRETVFAMGMVSQRCAAEALSRLGRLPKAKKLVSGKAWDRAAALLERRRKEAQQMAADLAQAKQAALEESADPPPISGRARPALPRLAVPSASSPAPSRTTRRLTAAPPAEAAPVRRPPRTVPRNTDHPAVTPSETNGSGSNTVTPIRPGVTPS